MLQCLYTFVAAKDMEDLVLNSIGRVAFDYIRSHTDLADRSSLTLSTTDVFNIEREVDGSLGGIINLRRTNDIPSINLFFRAVNQKLKEGGIFIGCVETYVLRKRRILKKYPPVLNYIYYSLDFIIKRVLPKLRATRYLYFLLTRGNNRVLSKAETFGRLSAAGFRIKDARLIGKFLYFVCEKEKAPLLLKGSNSGILIRLNRIGKNGRQIRVYKFRTMHAYSEYIQEYVYDLNALKEGGKLARDFRISTLGRIMRKFWIDEIPMLINLFKGEIKLVGVRPLSQHYYDLYDEKLKEKRIKVKPGLIPPFYADLPKTIDEIMESEWRYLKAYEAHPFRTDFRYLYKALSNILFRNARSS